LLTYFIGSATCTGKPVLTLYQRLIDCTVLTESVHIRTRHAQHQLMMCHNMLQQQVSTVSKQI